tara:strand:- start:3751 stop:4932 length:1182 start_codon:yes stop_codon:yes gene_type:complete
MAGVAAISLCAGQVSAKEQAARPNGSSIAYYLPKLDAEIKGSFRLVSCVEQPEFKSEFALIQKFVPDPAALVRLDTKIGFLAKRSVKVEYYPDGTLKTFNGSWEGQGGKVVTAAAKLALAALVPPSAAASLTGPEEKDLPPNSTCKPEYNRLLKNLDDVGKGIETIEMRLTETKATEADLKAHTILLLKKAEILKALTVNKTWPVEIENSLPGDCQSSFKLSTAPDYSQLFKSKADQEKASDLPAKDGIVVKICRATGARSESVGNMPEGNQKDLVYRVPVPGKLTLTVGDRSESFAIAVPQWAGPSYLKLGNGGMFGSREASAKFDAMGMPSELSYGSGGAATDIAGLLDTGREGVTALGSAELAGLQKDIAIEKARQELDALRAAGDSTDD